MRARVEDVEVHPLVAAAARGELPRWTRMSDERRAHAARVAELLGVWADDLGLSGEDTERWTAAGWLHDALKEAKPKKLLGLVGPEGRDLPEAVLHGPAAAARLAEEGVDDEELLAAVAWHTLGHPDLGPLGMAVYCADFLEPGRDLRNKWRARLREDMPGELEDVTREILKARIKHLLKKDRPVRPETMAFWNRLASGESWARASEV